MQLQRRFWPHLNFFLRLCHCPDRVFLLSLLRPKPPPSLRPETTTSSSTVARPSTASSSEIPIPGRVLSTQDGHLLTTQQEFSPLLQTIALASRKSELTWQTKNWGLVRVIALGFLESYTQNTESVFVIRTNHLVYCFDP